MVEIILAQLELKTVLEIVELPLVGVPHRAEEEIDYCCSSEKEINT
jgi:hypothetical protein